jgi:hypothetical protein
VGLRHLGGGLVVGLTVAPQDAAFNLLKFAGMGALDELGETRRHRGLPLGGNPLQGAVRLDGQAE